MNKERIKGGTQEAAGKVQKEFGKAVVSPRHVIQGGMKEAAGRTGKTVGGIRQDIEDARKGADRDAGKRGIEASLSCWQARPGVHLRAVAFCVV